MLQKTKSRLFIAALCVATLYPFYAAQGQPQTLADLTQAAETGAVSAQLQLAETYDRGLAVPQDFNLAAQWYAKAANQGNAAAQNRLGLYLRSGIGLESDNTKAFDWLSKAANAGKPTFIYDLAQMYEQGIGVAQNFAKAADLYTQPSSAGHVEAAVSLGVLYQNGTGVAQDFNKAYTLFFTQAQAGHPRAQNNLGLLYTRGQGVDQDYKEAADWYQRATNSGLTTAMTNLGVLYENGFGVKQSDGRAAELYRRAGQHKDTSFQALIERIGFIGDPRLKLANDTDSTLAAQETAAQRGDPVAQFLLGLIIVSQPHPKTNYTLAADLFSRAAKAGIPAARSNLGLLYFRGQGVPQDYATGYMWLSLAAANHQPNLAAIRDSFTYLLTQDQIKEAQQMAAAYWTDSK